MTDQGIEEARFQIRKVIAQTGDDLEPILGPWAWEGARLAELFYAILVSVSDVDEFALHDLVERMQEMALLNPDELGALDESAANTDPIAKRIQALMIEDGVSEEAAGRAVRAWVGISRVLSDRYAGLIQRYLREYAERLLAEAPSVFVGTSLSDAELRNALRLWLQVCFNMPLTLVDESMKDFCQSHKIKTETLIEAADSLNLSLPLLDDLLRMKAEAPTTVIKGESVSDNDTAVEHEERADGAQ